MTQSLPVMASDDGPPVICEPLDATGIRNDDQRSNSENSGTEWEQTVRSSLRMLRDLEARVACIAARYDVKLLSQEDEMSGAEWARRLTWAVEEIAEEFSHLCDINHYRFLEQTNCKEKALWEEQLEHDRWEIDELQGLVDAFHGLKHEFLPARQE